jgi:hypothetical protein
MSGEDEAMCSALTCRGSLHCRNEPYCVPPSELCDGVVHCPQYGEDEVYCQACPEGCHCQGNAVYCTQLEAATSAIHQKQICQYRDLKALVYTLIRLNNFRDLLCATKSLLYVVMQNVNISTISLDDSSTSVNLIYTTALRFLDLSHNKIQHVPNGQLVMYPFLLVLNMGFNKLKLMYNDSLYGLEMLHTLILSHNDITTFQAFTFKHTKSLSKLYIDHNAITALHPDQLPMLGSLKILQSDFSILCCLYIEAYKCSPKLDSSSPCYNMLDLDWKMIVIICQCLAIVSLNFRAIVLNLRNPTAEIAALLNLNAADMLTALSLLCTLAMNFSYVNRFMEVILQWQEHWLCHVIAFLTFTSTEASLLTLTYMFSKRVYFINQFKHAAFSKMDIITIILIWTFCLLTDILLFFVIRKPSSTLDLETNLCFLYDPMKKVVDHYAQITVGVFVILFNTCGLAVLTGCSLFLAQKLWVSQHSSAAKSSTKETSNFGLIKLFMLIICIYLSWFPLLILYTFTLSSYKIDKDMVTWYVVLTMPISAVINPIFHTILKTKKNNLS